MAFGGDVDTLALTFDKLQYIFRGYDQIRESFVAAHSSFKAGNMSEAEFFSHIEVGVMRFSALEFLALKAVFEIRKATARGTGTVKIEDLSGSVGQTQPPGHSIASFISPAALQRADMMQKGPKATTCICGTLARPGAMFCSRCGRKL